MKLPKHESLTLHHNPHKELYQTLQSYLDDYNDPPWFDWESEDHKRRALELNEIWVLYWNPISPAGFLCVAAPTLEELLKFVTG